MKISNSKKELAKIISENGGWRDGSNWAWYGNATGSGYFANSKPRFNKEKGTMTVLGSLGFNIHAFRCVKIPNWHKTILSRAEYFHLYPAPDADGWIECNGVVMPVCAGLEVDVRFRCGEVDLGKAAGAWQWVHGGWRHDIIAYRLHKPEQSTVESRLADAVDIVKSAAPTLMHDDMKFNGDEVMVESKPTIEQLAADYRNKLAYADRKQDEADKANMESDAALSELEKAIAEIGFTITPIGAVAKEPELVITCRSQLELEDVIWLSECRPKNEMPEGEYRVVKVGTIGVEFNGRTTYPDFSVRSWYFVRRPAK